MRRQKRREREARAGRSSPWIATRQMRRKEPRPWPGVLAFRILLGQAVRKGQWGAVLPIAPPHLSRKLRLLLYLRCQAHRQGHDPVIAPFSATDAEAAAFEFSSLGKSLGMLHAGPTCNAPARTGRWPQWKGPCVVCGSPGEFFRELHECS